MSATFETTPDQFAALAARPADTQVVMVNLLKFNTPGGRERYLRYGELVAPHVRSKRRRPRERPIPGWQPTGD